MLSCLFIAALWSPEGKGRDLLALVCGVYCDFWYLGTGVALNCIDS